jgi:hypothetical protein
VLVSNNGGYLMDSNSSDSGKRGAVSVFMFKLENIAPRLR